MSKPIPWSSSSQQQSERRRLPPISTSNSVNNPAASGSLAQSSTANQPQPSTIPSSSTRSQHQSRNSSISSSSTVFSPQTGTQQHQANLLLSSVRARNIASSSNSPLASSAAGLSAASQGGGVGASSGGGGPSKLARASPSLSQSSGSPITTTSNLTSGANNSQSLSKIVIAQIFLLLSTLKDNSDKLKWDTQAEQIRKLIDSHGMEVYSKYFRRLLTSNAAQIFPQSKGTDNAGTYQILVAEVQKIRHDPQQADKIAESLDTPEGDLFRDFDIVTFMDHFKMDPAERLTLALSLRRTSKADLRNKGDTIIQQTYGPFTRMLSDPDNQEDDVSLPILVSIIEKTLQDPPHTWNDDSRMQLHNAINLRYTKYGMAVPAEVRAAVHLEELLSVGNPLVRLVQRSSPRSTSSLDACKDMLASAETQHINYTQVACVLLYMVISRTEPPYNPSMFVEALRDHRSGKRLDWQDVVHAFDREGLGITKSQFLSLYRALLPLAQEYENFDIQLLWGGKWAYDDTQLSFIVAFLSCTPTELDATEIPRLRKAFTVEDFEDASEEVKSCAVNAVRHPLVSLDATSVLFHLIFKNQDTYNHAQSLGIPETVINTNTGIFVVSASAAPKPWGGLQDQALKQLFFPFLHKNLPDYNFVLCGLWKRDTPWLAQRLVDMYMRNPMTLLLVLEHAQENGWLEALSHMNNELSLDLIAAADGHGMMDIGAWAEEVFPTIPEVLSRALYTFITGKATHELEVQRERKPAETTPLRIRTVQSIINFLEGKVADDELTKLERQCIQTYPRLINYGGAFDEIIDANGKDGHTISPDADAMMQDHFKKLYSGDIKIEAFIQSLRTYKMSEDPLEQDLFACMISGLFDEYSCFGEYPLEALATTAVLFGSIINFDLLSRVALQAALSMVLDAVSQHPPEDSMFKFGLQALVNFRSRLSDWPTFCLQLMHVDHLRGTEVWTQLEEVARQVEGGDVNGEPNGFLLTNGNADDLLPQEIAVPDFSCLDVDSAVNGDAYDEPNEEVQDKVLFVLNNISERNLNDKLKDLKEALTEEHHRWFAQYLVAERAKVQPNFQQLYLEMLRLFNNKTLWAEVLRETYVASFAMLNAEASMNSSTERSHLKNLANWLGSLTLARDRPIKFKNISFKDLLLEGHETDRLVVVIPFTCKVISKVGKSAIYKPPNPWTMEIIEILVELYRFIEMKLNLKFEIEVMCSELGLVQEEIEPSTAIRSRQNEQVVDEYLQPVLPPEGLDPGFGDMSLVGLNRARGAHERFSPGAIQASLPDFQSLLSFPPSSSQPAAQMRLRQVLLQAAQNAISEIIAPVVERSVTIAAISASQLVTKDFATELDEVKLREAAHSVVKALSGSLALVTCKEPLRMTITNNIRILAARDLQEQALPEGLILMFVNDNLDLICSLVEQAAETQSQPEIDLHIEEAIRSRQRYRAGRSSEPFMEPPVSRWATAIPEPYKQSNGGLNSEQLAIYEDFARQSRGLPGHAANPSQDSGRQVPDVIQDQLPPVPNLPTPAEAPAIPRQGPQAQLMAPVSALQALQAQANSNGFMDPLGDRAQELLMALQRAAKEAAEESIKDLGPAAPTREIYEQLLQVVATTGLPHRDHLALTIAGKVTNMLYAEASRRIEVEVLVQLLTHLCQLSVQAARQIIIWLAGIEDDRIFNYTVTVALIEAELIDVRRVDMTIARALKERRIGAVDFLQEVADAMFLNDRPSAVRSDFAVSFEALTQWLAEEPELEVTKRMFSKLQVQGDNVVPPPPSGNKQDQLEYIFDEWNHLAQSDGDETGASAFVHQLYARHVLKDKDTCAYFIRVCIDSSINSYEQEEQNPYGTLDSAYVQIDALARLIVSIVLYQIDHESAERPGMAKCFDSMLSMVALVLCHQHRTRGERFNQKIYFRLFSSVLCELHRMSSALGTSEKEIMIVFSRALLALQPDFFPGFAFAWLGLVSHRVFMPAMLRNAADVGIEAYSKIMEALLTSVGVMLKPNTPSGVSRDFYRAVLKVLLILHHDFPEFLSEHHVSLCNIIPTRCVQLRNLIVSAYPASIPELPDPFSAGLKVDRIEEIRNEPLIRYDIEAPLDQAGIKDILDGLMRSTEQSAEALSKVCHATYAPTESSSANVNLPLLSSIVLYICKKALSAAGTKTATFVANSPEAKLLENLAKQLPVECRFFYINVILNQLRYPNSHTHYFSYALLHIFGAPGSDQPGVELQELITRALLERLLVHRPHPWGLIITLLEIIKNPTYQFWDLDFVKAAPEVSRSVRSYLG
ncbi:Not1-domain-containing protein [Aulographum hederae CBS 113979]|uniref:General negative regulator of transcription subunit 1 n=1 Tax=Aulographum hederae CBS 113979 TaxID=1176131 RepID=A0A6G1H2J0_9PEZI|nr:Not1-domain-containing protein [Aulographum hederae CBS 113979]